MQIDGAQVTTHRSQFSVGYSPCMWSLPACQSRWASWWRTTGRPGLLQERQRGNLFMTWAKCRALLSFGHAPDIQSTSRPQGNFSMHLISSPAIISPNFLILWHSYRKVREEDFTLHIFFGRNDAADKKTFNSSMVKCTMYIFVVHIFDDQEQANTQYHRKTIMHLNVL